MARMVYLDNSATTKPFDEICAEVGKTAGSTFGNPSSLHEKGVEAEKIVKWSRNTVAGSLGTSSGEIFFTSGGTESNNIALLGVVNAHARKLGTIVTTSIEHASVLSVFMYLKKRGCNTAFLPVDSRGIVNMDALAGILKSRPVSLVSIMHANNEMGTLQPIEEIISLKRKYGFILHIDAVQSYCKLKLDGICKSADLVSISGHKIHALKGTGALYIKKGTRVEPLYHGGGQEGCIKPGTENVIGIWSLGRAVELNLSGKYGDFERVRELRNLLVQRIIEEVPGAELNGTLDSSLSAPHISNISFDGIPGEVFLHALEQRGVFVSTGSACSSKKKSLSHVLSAMGVKDSRAKSSVRFSLSLENTREDIEYCIGAVKESIKSLGKLKR